MQKQECKVDETVEEDHCCSICLGVFYKPVKLSKCKHEFCQNCLNDVSLITGNYKCPLCRTEFKEGEILPNQQLWQMIKKKYPHSINERQKLITQRKPMRFIVGNTTQVLPQNQGNRYRWELYLKPAPGDKHLSESISQVEVRLHQTFNPNKIMFDLSGSQQVKVARLGWGTFRIEMTIFWKQGLYEQKSSQIHHDLQFSPVSERTVQTYLTKRVK